MVFLLLSCRDVCLSASKWIIFLLFIHFIQKWLMGPIVRTIYHWILGFLQQSFFFQYLAFRDHFRSLSSNILTAGCSRVSQLVTPAPGLAENIGNLAVTGSCQVFAQPSSYDCENDEWAQYFIWNYSLLNIGPEN